MSTSRCVRSSRALAAWCVGAVVLTSLVQVPAEAARRKAPAVAAAALAVPAVAVVSVPLSERELALAASVYVGVLPCELGQSVSLQPDPAAPGYFHLKLKSQSFHLRPVESATGALRLEDASQGAVWLQLGNKSMLMHQKLGRRLADECMGPLQQAMNEHLKLNPAPNLLDVAQSPRQD